MTEPMLPTLLHDEQAMQNFVRDFRRHLREQVMPGAQQVYEEQVRPEFNRQQGRDFENYHEVRKAMIRNGYYQFWSAMQRRSQELMWESVIEPTERELNALIDRYQAIARENPAGGSLLLDSELQTPRYHTAVDIHLQPGGYHTESVSDDVTAGSLYLGGIPIYIDGQLGPESDGIGRALVHYLQQNYPDFQAETVLDMGCAVGNSTVPWVRAFPDAQVHAIDVAAPCLRFGHARAEAMNERIHFSQQNAERTRFEDSSFDLIVSHIMLHETSRTALKNILAESHRLLKPGGLMLHLDVPRGNTVFEQFMSQWETYNNNEVFSSYMTDVNLPDLAASCGFEESKVFMAGAVPAAKKVKHAYNATGFEWPVLVGWK